MDIPKIYSVKAIEQRFLTGEEPVLVRCSDKNAYICKYVRSSASSYKLVCELIGALTSKAWGIYSPEVAFVLINPRHWAGLNVSHSVSAPAFGSKRMEKVVDITPTTIAQVIPSAYTLKQLMYIALFDFWIANEDRNANNANLMYDMVNDRLVSIDYGCILNTATFDYPLSQLTSTDTILWSDLFKHISRGIKEADVIQMANELNTDYQQSIQASRLIIRSVVNQLPEEWHVASGVVEEKLHQLVREDWTNAVWENFMENLEGNITK